MRRILTNASMLPTLQLAKELVSVDEWDCDVMVWELTVKELDEYRSAMIETKGAKVVGLNMAGNTARLLLKAIKDEAGNPVFTSVEQIEAQGSGPIERLAAVARRLSHMDDDDDQQLAGN